MEAVILAAGLSRRMGRDKLTLDLGGRPVLAWTIEAVQRACPGLPLSVVVPPAGPVFEMAGRAKGRRLVNPRPEGGLSGSLRVACRAAASPPLLVFLGDQPALSRVGVDAVLGAAAESPAVWLAAPWYRGAPGHPVLIGSGLFPRIEELRGDRGARSLWAAVPEGLRRRVEVNADPPPDLDTPDDYRRWQDVWASEGKEPRNG